jgi:hypothetical protein
MGMTTMKRAVPQSWGTSNGTFQAKKVGTIDISFMEYSASKSVRLTRDIVCVCVSGLRLRMGYCNE